MRLRTAVIVMSLSLACFLSRVSFADTLTMQSGYPADDQFVGAEYVYPYYFTFTGPGGTDSLVAMSCMNYNRDIGLGESWDVTPVLVSTINPSSSIDNGAFNGAQVLEDAYLFNEYAAATGNATLTSEIQYAIWSIMDPTDINSSNSNVNFFGAFDPTSQGLAATAISLASTEPSSYYRNDVAFVPVNGTQTAEPGDSSTYGEPQLFMTDPVPPAITPEPTSLILLGTGLLGTVAFMRRKHGKA